MKKTLMLLFFVSGWNSAYIRAQVKEPYAKPESSLIGQWEVWIRGAITYTATETAVYQKYTPGAAMNRLEIKPDGAYQWGNKKGRLLSTKPWHAQEGRSYYRISDLKGNEYDFWYDGTKDQLTVLFGEVGGHAATGTRLKAKNSKPSKTAVTSTGAVKKEVSATSPAATFKTGEKVEIEWKGQWYKGTILEGGKNTYKVNYEGWGSLYDEWVAPSRLRKGK